MATTKQIADRLSQPIPLPRSTPPKPQSSWATLKAGDRLQLRDSPIGEAPCSDNLNDISGEVWVVGMVDSAGARLDREVPGWGAGDSDSIVLTKRSWRDTWERVRRGRKGESK